MTIDRDRVIDTLSRRAADILARHGYPEKPLSGELDLGWLPIADMAALASAATTGGEAPGRDDGWQPISTAPKDGTEFAAYENGDVYKCDWRDADEDGEGWFDHVNETFENPTLWQPLPAIDSASPRSSQKEEGV